MAHVLQLATYAFLFVEYLPEDGRKRPEHVGGLPHGHTFTVK